MITKAITLHPEHAQAIVDGRKWIETRPSPPNGNMRPAGVRGLPGCAIDRGDCIAIHSGAPDFAIVAVVTVTDAAMICTPETIWDVPPETSAIKLDGDAATYIRLNRLCCRSEWWFGQIDIADQLPLGDFTLGRWAWELFNVEALDEPVSCKGKQGVWRIPDDLPGRKRIVRAERIPEIAPEWTPA